MIKEHGGRIIDTAGDGILAEFGSVVNAAECAVAIQRKMAERNVDVEEARRMRFRIGINQGDVVFDDTRVLRRWRQRRCTSRRPCRARRHLYFPQGV
jgi:adenylate cyclase